MLIEAELKTYADDLEGAMAKLLERGGELQSEQVETDEYFSHPVRDFGETDEALRIRDIDIISSLVEDERGKLSSGSCEISYKGPKLGTTGKSREEYTISIDNRVSGSRILEKLGFNSVRIVRKRRRIYNYNDYKITLDDVEDLGGFIEIERMIESKAKLDSILSDMEGIIKDIFSLDRFERKSYLELLLEKSEEGN
jgi:adenylate cyclase class 2